MKKIPACAGMMKKGKPTRCIVGGPYWTGCTHRLPPDGIAEDRDIFDFAVALFIGNIAVGGGKIKRTNDYVYDH
jgi:hypothetical protein